MILLGRRWFFEQLSYRPVGWYQLLTPGGLSQVSKKIGDSHPPPASECPPYPLFKVAPAPKATNDTARLPQWQPGCSFFTLHPGKLQSRFLTVYEAPWNKFETRRNNETTLDFRCFVVASCFTSFSRHEIRRLFDFAVLLTLHPAPFQYPPNHDRLTLLYTNSLDAESIPRR